MKLGTRNKVLTGRNVQSIRASLREVETVSHELPSSKSMATKSVDQHPGIFLISCSGWDENLEREYTFTRLKDS